MRQFKRRRGLKVHKQCSCGRKFKYVNTYAIAYGVWWNCACGSTLYNPSVKMQNLMRSV